MAEHIFDPLFDPARTGEPESLRNFRWFDLRHAANNKPPLPDLVLPGLRARSVASLVGAGATGKSMWALQAGVAVAGGADTLGLARMVPAWSESRPTGRVLYLSGEDGVDVLHDRFHALAQRMNAAERENTFEHFSIAPLDGCQPSIVDPSWRLWIGRVAADARLVILDTLRLFHAGEENDSGDAAKLIGYMKALCLQNGTTLLFLHHVNKLASLSGTADAQQASRGSSTLTDNVRLQMNLVGMSPQEAERFEVHEDCRRNFVRLVCSKVNYGVPPADRWYRRGDGGLLEPAVLTEGGGNEQQWRQRDGF